MSAILLCLLVQSMFLAESAVLVHLDAIRIVLLVLHCVVVSLFAFCASKCDLNAHNAPPNIVDIFFAT